MSLFEAVGEYGKWPFAEQGHGCEPAAFTPPGESGVANSRPSPQSIPIEAAKVTRT
jgi:hypothetical protein